METHIFFFLLPLSVFFLHCAQAAASAGGPHLCSEAHSQPGLSDAPALLGPTLGLGSPGTRASLPSGSGHCKLGHWLWVWDTHRKGASTRQGRPPERGARGRRVFSAEPTRVMDPGTGRFAGQEGITGLWLRVSAPCCISQVLTQLKAQHQNTLQPDDKIFDLYLWVT